MFHSNRIYLTVDHVFHQRNVRILIFRTEGSAVALVLWLLCGRGKNCVSFSICKSNIYTYTSKVEL